MSAGFQPVGLARGSPQPAVVIAGPTGSGKTPLGDALEAAGFLGRRCFHFDFGRNLRAAADGVAECGLSAGEIEYLRRVLRDGLLLENDRFALALKILTGFIGGRRMKSDDLLAMNGLPRHEGQADSLEPVLDVRVAVQLRATPAVIMERIRRNTGGDREGRTDDSPAEIARRILLFDQRTIPLLDRYRTRGVRVISVGVGVETTAQDIVRVIEEEIGDQADVHKG
jgi:adenylate kinase family enzyme